MWYMIRNLRCTVTIDSVMANSKTQNAFLFTVNVIFRHDYPLAVEPGSTPRPLVPKETWRVSLPMDMLLSAVSVLVVAQSSSEIPEGHMNNPVFIFPVYVCQVGWSVIPYLLDWGFSPQIQRSGSMKSCQILSAISAYRHHANRRFFTTIMIATYISQ